MTRPHTAAIAAERLSRRAAVNQLAGAGAAAAIAATSLGRSRAGAHDAPAPVRSSAVAAQEGTPLTDTTPTTGPPTVVLVHGAFAESSSWNEVIAELLTQGLPVVAAANPLRGVEADAAGVAGLLATIEGQVVLVGHSYGGSVITNAATAAENVAALVYVCAYAPDAGESASGLSALIPGGTLGTALAPPVALPDGSQDLYIRADRFHAQFAADLPEAQASWMRATQRPIAAAALDEASGDPAWRRLPSWFVYGEDDLNIPAALHVFMAERAGSRSTVGVPGGSHVVMISRPQAVVDAILGAVDAVS